MLDEVLRRLRPERRTVGRFRLLKRRRAEFAALALESFLCRTEARDARGDVLAFLGAAVAMVRLVFLFAHAHPFGFVVSLRCRSDADSHHACIRDSDWGVTAETAAQQC
ncbi:MAG: hypothetical protein ACREDL_18570, partial [Bradyrhizobium sp.]